MGKYKYCATCNVGSLELEGEVEANSEQEANKLITEEFLHNCGFDIDIDIEANSVTYQGNTDYYKGFTYTGKVPLFHK